MAVVDESWDAQVSAVAALGEPTRRRAYEHVVRQPVPVSRDEVAAALKLPRTTAAFHLDRLVDERLLVVVHERRTGRSGPGAGRPSKLYHRSPDQIAVSLPERRYDLAGQLLADAVQEAEQSGEPPRTVLQRRAREVGRELGEAARGGQPGGGDPRALPASLAASLAAYGFEPRVGDDGISLTNCPFHTLAQQHTDLVCGMNLCLLEGLLDGIGRTDLTARLRPAPGHCCVRFEPAADA